jgi:hypothetical protein
MTIKYILVGLILVPLCGCVERLITVSSKPEGAIVWLNNEEVGATPVTVAFTWYGDYGVTMRKEGYETIHSSRKAEPPVYQWLGIDLIAECLPFSFTDAHHWEFEMKPVSAVAREPLIERARSLRERALNLTEETPR